MKLNAISFLNCIDALSEILPCPAAFFTEEGQLLGCTHPDNSALALQIMKLCLQDPEYAKDTAALHGALFSYLYNEENEFLCIALLLDAPARDDLLPLIRSFLLLSLKLQDTQKQLFPESGKRLSFVYQLLYSKSAQDDMLRARAAQLHYVLDLSRVVILFLVAPSTDSHSIVLTDFSTGDGQRIFIQALNSAEGHSTEDIGDFMNLTSFSLLKYIPTGEEHHLKEYLLRFIEPILDTMYKVCGLQLRVCVGSCYQNLLELRSSYTEAVFLARNFDFFADSEKQILFINDHIYDYLTSLIPESYLKEKFDATDKKLTERPILEQTLVALSKHNMNLRSCADALGLHRNTMQQRYEKIRSQLHMDPASNDRDRMTARQYVLYSHKKTIFHIGTIIQSSSVLNLLLRKLAEQVYHNSDGEMEIDIHTMDTTGDNRVLFDLLLHGELDAAVGNPDSLIALTGEQISVINAPFLFDTPRQALTLLNSPVIHELLEPLKETGFINLGFWSMGWRYFSWSGDLSVRLPSDLSGKHIRIMQKPLITSYLRYLDAVPRFISYDKILSALDEGLIDMQENPYWNFYEMRFYQHQKNILEMNMLFDSDVLLTTDHTWSHLTTRQQTVLKQSVDSTTRWNWDLFRPITEECREKILHQGVKIHYPAPDEENIWRQSARAFLDQSSYAGTVEKIEWTKRRYQENL